ncbi:MAG: hypothetical protein HQL60_05305 [Magnetococcales bacterium]|nr:hypothetical protein [Magnetococcales bacterium]
MTIWNFLVIVCFIVLYMGVALVFLQVRRLQDEWRVERDRALEQQQQPATVCCDARQLVEPLLQEVESIGERCSSAVGEASKQGSAAVLGRIIERINALEERLLVDIENIPDRIKPEFDELRSGIRLFARQEGSDHGAPPVLGFDDAYREARLLLGHGVDEEHVSSSTGLTVEEVGLIKSMLSRDNPKDQSPPMIHDDV